MAPGANRRLIPAAFEAPDADALVCQLEIPVETVGANAAAADVRYRRHVQDLLHRRADLQGVSGLADLMSDGTRWAV